MGENTQSTPTAQLERLLSEERRRTDYLLSHLGSALVRIDTRLAAIETRLGQSLTPVQWVKVLTGIGLPLAVLWLTGSVETALRFVSP